MVTRLVGPLLLCTLSLTALAACSAEVDDAVDDATSEEELNAAGRALIGAYTGSLGPVHGIVLTAERVGQQNRFSADVDTGIRCITAPCPSEEHVEGTFSAGSKTITLRSTTASSRVAKVLGKYRYTREGDTLTLVKGDLTLSLTAAATSCYSSDTCAAGEHCSTEDGVCNSSGMIQVCSGTCVKPSATAQ